MDIVCLGDLLVDMFPAEYGRRLAEVSAFFPKPGGAPANAAVAAARLGARSAFVGKVGDDAFGHHLVEVLRANGVDTRGVRFDREARTTLAFIAKPDANTQEFVFYRNPGADMRLSPEELDRELLQETRVLHFTSLSLGAEPIRSTAWEAINLARQGGALISFDVNYRPSLWESPQQALEQIRAMIPHVDLVKVNEVELELLTGSQEVSTSRHLLELGPRLVVVTLGPLGSYFATAEGGEHVPPFQVEAVDATGCGDAFIAGLLWQLVAPGNWRAQLTAERLRAILRYANAVGALTATKVGVIPALPTAAEVEAFLSQVR
ncbi:MAG: PfkB family carbohydrate kinase [Anaerolineae bacterium]|nr:PfkB family carbohydrate kinase [Anaerolineae bacterium]MDW8070985.1 PfkB family carbohydrate kinase [Anaerolineae bacterium]